MANILFKKGTYSEFKNNILTNTSNIVDGALYLTTDEGGLYLGVQNDEGVKSVTRIQGSLLYFNSLKEFQDSVAPPYSTDVVYLIAEDNALVRWTGTKWTVLNATASEVTTAIDKLRELIDNNSTQILGEKSRAEAKEGELLTLINQQGETLEAHNQALANKVDKGTYDTLVSAVSANSQSIEGLSTRTDKIETEINTTIKPDIVKNKDAAKAAHDAATEANNNANNRLLSSDFTTFKNGDFKTLSDKYSDLEARVGNEELLSAGFTESLKKCLTIDGKTAMTGNLNMGSKKIQSVADGTDPTDAVNLQQLQAVSSGINGEFTEVKQDIADNAELINKINSLLTDKVKIDDTSGKITLINDLDANEHIIQNIVYPLDASNKEIINDTDVANVAYVKAQMKAAEAMTFKGVVSNTKALPTSGVQTGDTYKVGVAYDYVIGQDAKGKNITKTANVGDLFINSAADDATPQWEHVSSGYEESSQQNIFSGDDYLYLSDGINNTATAALSKISFVGADHSNFNFTIAQSLSGNQTNNTVTASLVWGSF